MTLSIRPADERGHADHGWLKSHHSFSFAHYYDAHHMGFRSLRVINDDVIGPTAGFDTHGHRDMEIVTYVINGSLSHRDTTGGSGVLARGDVQAMTAGTGIRHSEFNASRTERLHLLQIWLQPETEGIHASVLEAGQSLSHSLAQGRGAWIQVALGEISVNGIALKKGDGLSIEDEDRITISTSTQGEFLLFDLA